MKQNKNKLEKLLNELTTGGDLTQIIIRDKSGDVCNCGAIENTMDTAMKTIKMYLNNIDLCEEHQIEEIENCFNNLINEIKSRSQASNLN